MDLDKISNLVEREAVEGNFLYHTPHSSLLTHYEIVQE